MPLNSMPEIDQNVYSRIEKKVKYKRYLGPQKTSTFNPKDLSSLMIEVNFDFARV
jgi:tRNA U34 5-carboxymethylaminomethyl modifying enzyme MnmG/GidA